MLDPRRRPSAVIAGLSFMGGVILLSLLAASPIPALAVLGLVVGAVARIVFAGPYHHGP